MGSSRVAGPLKWCPGIFLLSIVLISITSHRIGIPNRKGKGTARLDSAGSSAERDLKGGTEACVLNLQD